MGDFEASKIKSADFDDEAGHADQRAPAAPRKHGAAESYKAAVKIVETKRGLDRLPRLVAELDWEHRTKFRYDNLDKLRRSPQASWCSRSRRRSVSRQTTRSRSR